MAGTIPTTAESDTSASKHAQITELLSSGDWDQRLEAARAQREKVLAEKNRGPKPPPVDVVPKSEPADVTATPTPAPAAAAPMPPPEPAPGLVPPPEPVRGPVPAFARTPPPLTAPKTEKPVLRAIRHQAIESVRRPSGHVRTAATRRAPSLSGRAALLAVVCCVALGFGLSLGFGTALSIGALPEAEAEAPVITAASPTEIAPEDAPQAPAEEADTPDAPTAEAAPEIPLFDIAPDPPAAPVRPRIHLYAPDSVTTAALDESKAELGQNGFEIATVQRLSLTISAPHVRFYDATDATVARTLARDLRIEARDFSESGNGAPGRVEVWLDGTTDRRPTWRQQPNPVDDLIRLGNRFLRSLQ
ncbi:hypothetical protein [Roseobacter sinensis]|uniref:Uncharacterized protein n=1 Tax=Roseobacter sinensis TaxID=2931391 RepID=A0ABT3BHB6_9RHOB|nr:hypothetical protein [Roseobacter sp. WL0113]MCV3272573.1 hypothetical protein [Roseobacter sp. WL0113]